MGRPTETMRRQKAVLARTEAVIRKRYSEFDLGLIDVAADVGCSPRQVQRVLRELADTDFRSTLLQVRMEVAHRLLSRKHNAPSVRQTARQVGYREASGLRQRFKPFFGVNPSEVRMESYDYDAAWRAEEEADE